MGLSGLTFLGNSVYIYSFPDMECANLLWTTQVVDPEDLIQTLLELNRKYEEWQVKAQDEIYDGEKQQMVPNPAYVEGFPYPCYEQALKEKYGMVPFNRDMSCFVPDGIYSGQDYENKLREMQNRQRRDREKAEQEKADDLSNRNE